MNFYCFSCLCKSHIELSIETCHDDHDRRLKMQIHKSFNILYFRLII